MLSDLQILNHAANMRGLGEKFKIKIRNWYILSRSRMYRNL